MGTRVFLSYRRSDSDAIAHRMYATLVAAFGKKAIFIDADKIPFTDFRTHLARELQGAKVVLVIISRQWLDTIKARAADPEDWVRLEIETALKEGIPIAPVLVGQTPMPKEADLPPSIAALAHINALTVSPGEDFDHHMQRLVRRLATEFALPLVRRSAMTAAAAAAAVLLLLVWLVPTLWWRGEPTTVANPGDPRTSSGVVPAPVAAAKLPAKTEPPPAPPLPPSAAEQAAREAAEITRAAEEARAAKERLEAAAKERLSALAEQEKARPRTQLPPAKPESVPIADTLLGIRVGMECTDAVAAAQREAPTERVRMHNGQTRYRVGFGGQAVEILGDTASGSTSGSKVEIACFPVAGRSVVVSVERQLNFEKEVRALVDVERQLVQTYGAFPTVTDQSRINPFNWVRFGRPYGPSGLIISKTQVCGNFDATGGYYKIGAVNMSPLRPEQCTGGLFVTASRRTDGNVIELTLELWHYGLMARAAAENLRLKEDEINARGKEKLKF